MKLEKQRQTVERSGVAKEGHFNINMNAHAFDILSAGIYTDPIMAVVRELACNARDAMVDAGKADTPFEIHLPNALEPWLSIKDSGTGLSDKQIFEMYTTYFDSTKDDSNEFIGAFGLGSKSPFAYSEAFEVIVHYEGMKRTYSVFKDEEGIPSIARLAEIKTTEPNGLEVKIAVKSEDYSTFKYRTAEILRYFKVKPEVVGVSHFKFDSIEDDDAVQGDGYFVTPASSWRGGELTAVQGDVPYVADKEQLTKNMSPGSLAFLKNYNVVAFVDIGLLDVAASREEIRYNKRTIKNLVAAIEQARKDFLSRVENEINTLAKVGKRWEIYSALASHFSDKNEVVRIADGFKFTNKTFNEWLKTAGSVSFSNPAYHSIAAYKSGSARAVRQTLSTDPDDVSKYMITATKATHIVVNDVKHRSSVRLNEFLDSQTTHNTRAIMVTPIGIKTLNKSTNKPQKSYDYDKAIKAFGKELGNPTIVNLSDVSSDVVVNSKRGSKRKVGLTFKHFVASYEARSDRVRPLFSDIGNPTAGLYVNSDAVSRVLTINGKECDWNHTDTAKRFELMVKVINTANGTSHSADEIIGVGTKALKSIDGEADWVELGAEFEKALKVIKPAFEFDKRLDHTTTDYDFKRMSIEDATFKKMVEDDLASHSPFRTAIMVLIDAENAITKTRQVFKNDYGFKGLVESICIALEINVLNRLSNKPFFKSADFADYTVLKFIASLHLTDRNKKDFVDYIEAVDNA